MSFEKVVMSNGREITLFEIYNSVSVSLFQSSIHHEVCSYLVGNSGVYELFDKVLINLYCSKSTRLRLITSLVWFAEYNKEEIQEVCVLNDAFDILIKRGFFKSKLSELGVFNGEYIDKKHIVIFLIKSLSHRLFRLFSKKLPDNIIVVRGWVDVTESMYMEELKFSRLRIFPFPLGIKRQLKFIGKCKKNGLDYELSGLPYSIFSAFKAIFNGHGRDQAIASMEIIANQKYAIELLKSNVTEIYTSDEFEVGAVAMYELLIDAGVKVTNTAHGVGVYCPFVAYTDFIGFTHSQISFYLKNNKMIRGSCRSYQNSKIPLRKAEEAKDLPLAFVLMHQNFVDYGLIADADAMSLVAQKVSDISIKLNLPFFIKLHPNSPPSKSKEFERIFCGKVILNYSSIYEYRPVFITINSTSFFDTMEFGPTLVYSGPSFFPEIYYGNDFIGFGLNDLEKKISALIKPEDWYHAVINRTLNTDNKRNS